jgi:acyl-CoA thioester hydrolase
MREPFRTRIAARGYEVDANGHVAGSVLLQYSQHARWECLRAAGIDQHALLANGIGPVSLEENIRYHREVRAGDELDVTCTVVFGDAKTYRVEQELRRTDGVLVAEVSSIGGLLDLADRRLIPNPAERWLALATTPSQLGQ